jgi:tetratricopeptide (TPR) repeat protein
LLRRWPIIGRWRQIRLRSDVGYSHAYRGDVFYNQKDYASAVANYDKALEIDGPRADWLNERCWIRVVWGRELDKAIVDCNAALKIEPDSPNIVDSRGMANFKLGKFAEALADYEAALKGNANAMGSLYGRGMSRLRLGQAEASNVDIAKAEARDPKVAERFAGYGVKP